MEATAAIESSEFDETSPEITPARAIDQLLRDD